MTQTNKKVSPAVSDEAIAASQSEEDGRVKTLTSGVRVRLKAVPLGLVEEVTAAIKEPKPPMWENPDKGRMEPNPSDPDYLQAVEDANRERSIAAIETVIMFGLDLMDGLPEDDDWVNRLQFMEMKGRIDLSEYDLDNAYHKEFLYKRYIAVAGADDMKLIQNMVGGIDPEDVEELRDGKFLDDAARDGDSGQEDNG